MLYKRKEVNVRPQTIASVPVQPTIVEHDREVVIERTGWSSGAVALATIGGLLLLGILFYYLWYAPANNPSQPSVIERTTTIQTSPAPSAPTTTTIINPPATTNTPPVHIENNVNPPADNGEAGTTGRGTSGTGDDGANNTNGTTTPDSGTGPTDTSSGK